MTDAQLRNPNGVKDAIHAALLAVYNAELNDTDTRAVFERLAAQIPELLELPDCGKRNRAKFTT